MSKRTTRKAQTTEELIATLDSLRAAHPDFHFESLEQNTTEMGLETGSDEWLARVIADARDELGTN
jgi:hypothetical protein